jgi:hypothetical protein
MPAPATLVTLALGAAGGAAATLVLSWTIGKMTGGGGSGSRAGGGDFPPPLRLARQGNGFGRTDHGIPRWEGNHGNGQARGKRTRRKEHKEDGKRDTHDRKFMQNPAI